MTNAIYITLASIAVLFLFFRYVVRIRFVQQEEIISKKKLKRELEIERLAKQREISSKICKAVYEFSINQLTIAELFKITSGLKEETMSKSILFSRRMLEISQIMETIAEIHNLYQTMPATKSKKKKGGRLNSIYQLERELYNYEMIQDFEMLMLEKEAQEDAMDYWWEDFKRGEGEIACQYDEECCQQ